MKDFEKILRMTQPELKLFLDGYLAERGYDVISEDGFLYAKGSLPVLLVAHMDRYPESHQGARDFKTRYPHSAERVVEIEKTIANGRTIWSSPQGICADDRAGIWTIMKLIQRYHPSVLFTEDEELKKTDASQHGSVKFCRTNYVHGLDVNFMIQIDRCGSSDVAFYKCENDDFKHFIQRKTNYRTVDGTSTDIRYIMPISNIAGVNFSCGYYDEHHVTEYVVIEEMQHTLNVIDHLLESENSKRVFEACVRKEDFDYVKSLL